MASSLMKATGKTLKKGAKAKGAAKLAKGTTKTVTKTVQGAAVTKAVKGVLSNMETRTRNGIFLGIGATTAGGAFLLARRRRRSAAEDPGRTSGDLNDPALARKVESEIFRPADAPKATVSVNVEHGVVFLRGTVRDPGQGEQLEKTARSVDGVKDVQNLLHQPGEPAQSKTESHDTVERPT